MSAQESTNTLRPRRLRQAIYESERNTLEYKIAEQQDDARYHNSLGVAYVDLGRKEDAIREGNLGVELLPVSKDVVKGTFRLKDLARIYVMVGEFGAAVDQLEDLLSIPGELSKPLLRLDPVWDPLCNHPRFKKLIESDK